MPSPRKPPSTRRRDRKRAREKRATISNDQAGGYASKQVSSKHANKETASESNTEVPICQARGCKNPKRRGWGQYIYRMVWRHDKQIAVNQSTGYDPANLRATED